MKANFQAALARILVYEGGKVNNPKDPGGKTNKGITQATYSIWLQQHNRVNADVYAILNVDVAAIYEGSYWDRIQGDSLPSGLDLAVFDAAVNSGVGQATSWLQATLGIKIDGDFGNATKQHAMAADAEATIDGFCARRLGTLQHLKTWSTFGKGWSARISNVKKISDAWAEAGSGAGNGPPPVIVSSLGGHVKANADDIKTNNGAIITAHAVAIGGVVTTVATTTTSQLTGVGDTFPWIKWVLGGLAIAGAAGSALTLMAKSANDAAGDGTALAKVSLTADDHLPIVPIVDTPDASVSDTVKAVTKEPLVLDKTAFLGSGTTALGPNDPLPALGKPPGLVNGNVTDQESGSKP